MYARMRGESCIGGWVVVISGGIRAGGIQRK